MQAVSSLHLNEAETDLLDVAHVHDRAVLQHPFSYPCEGWRCLAFNAGVALLGLTGSLFMLATCF